MKTEIRPAAEDEPVRIENTAYDPTAEIPCKWCDRPTFHTGTKMCDGCWELDSRIRGNTSLARTILKAAVVKQLESRLVEYRTAYLAMGPLAELKRMPGLIGHERAISALLRHDTWHCALWMLDNSVLLFHIDNVYHARVSATGVEWARELQLTI